MDVCGAPALTERVVSGYVGSRPTPDGRRDRRRGQVRARCRLAAARRAGAGRDRRRRAASRREAAQLRERRRWPTTWSSPTPATRSRCATRSPPPGGPADVTVVCVDVPGCEGGAILATAERGTVIFFSMATSFSAAALGAEGLAADVTMLVGNGYAPGHAAYALDLLRSRARAVRRLFETG